MAGHWHLHMHASFLLEAVLALQVARHVCLVAESPVSWCRKADISMACSLAIDSKTDYPAACNAVEKILVHADLADDGRLYKLQVRTCAA